MEPLVKHAMPNAPRTCSGPLQRLHHAARVRGRQLQQGDVRKPNRPESSFSVREPRLENCARTGAPWKASGKGSARLSRARRRMWLQRRGRRARRGAASALQANLTAGNKQARGTFRRRFSASPWARNASPACTLPSFYSSSMHRIDST